MSETDSFIDEVAEEVRRDRLFAVLRRYGWIGILAVLLIVGGAAWNEWQKAQAKAEAEAFGDAILAALAADDPAARTEALSTVPTAQPGQAALLSFLAADEALKQGNAGAAETALERVASDAGAPESYRQLAELKYLILKGPALNAQEREERLAALSVPGAPYRPLALEQQGLSLIASGKTEEALALYQQLVQEAGVTAGLKQRALQMIVVLGGEPAQQ
ncbi:tetratricopeptide repeat protein [Albidovulum sediminicola]|uniref:Tetratricopeptide repeat protein n=1 Tax=Albidovulum sediminicola TaxID=2984331 RepID=A0ABT2Z510_9RHOB|nr:tetratricopeptide repeat protein [Defluviimonas sp. WL0075]MCV2865861.1 tetratricopeptide repeat protein [Defluviimonas sp. WL0075]